MITLNDFIVEIKCFALQRNDQICLFFRRYIEMILGLQTH